MTGAAGIATSTPAPSSAPAAKSSLFKVDEAELGDLTDILPFSEFFSLIENGGETEAPVRERGKEAGEGPRQGRSPGASGRGDVYAMVRR